MAVALTVTAASAGFAQQKMIAADTSKPNEVYTPIPLR
jgi:hypothetical protein